MFPSGISKFTSNPLICCKHSSQILFTPEEQRPSSPKVKKPCFIFASRTKKLAAKLSEASSKANTSSEMVKLATTSLKRYAEYKRGRDEKVAKLRDELSRERASRIEEAAGSRES